MGFDIKGIQKGLTAASQVGAKNSNFQPPFHSDDNNSYARRALDVVDRLRQKSLQPKATRSVEDYGKVNEDDY